MKLFCKNKINRHLALIIVCSSLIATGCSVDQEISINLSGAGKTNVRISLEPAFVDYLVSLAELTGEKISPSKVFFNVPEVKSAVEDWPGVRAVQISVPTPEQLDIELTFDNIEDVIAPTEQYQDAASHGVSLISLTGTDDRRILQLHLDNQTYRQLATLFPLLEHPLIVSLGPQPNLAITDSEYLEMMQFVLGDAGPSTILSSEIKIKITVEGQLIEQSGGELQKDGSVEIIIPLLRILVLDEPLDYYIIFEQN